MAALLLCVSNSGACGRACGGHPSAPKPTPASAPSLAPSYVAPSGAAPSGVASVELQVMGAVNELRQQAGRPGLRMAASLTTAAQSHAAYMATHDVLTHEEDPGRSGFSAEGFSARVEAAGYTGSARAEVVAQAGSALQAVALWRDSPRHLELVLLKDATEMGVGQQGRYWCVNLGTGPSPSMIVEPSR